MKDIKSVRLLTITLLVMGFIAFSASSLTSKDNKYTPGHLEVFGKIRSGNIIPADAMITVYKDGEQKDSYKPDENGHFDIKLPLNGAYALQFTGYMMISKTVQVNSTVPNE